MMKKNAGSRSLLILAALSVINASSCNKKTDVPVVLTSEISEISQDYAVSGGTVSDDGGADVTDSGICWSTDEEPTIEDAKISCCAGTGSFIVRLKPLTPGTRYYVRAYATNSEGTAYGDQRSFETEGKSSPKIITTIVTGIDLTTALSGGLVYDFGGWQVTARGVCWSKNPSPTILDNKTSDSFISYVAGGFTSSITGLEKGTRYFVRAYATTDFGTFYGNETDFTTRSVALPSFNPAVQYGTLTDIDGNNYRTIDFGNQTWMAENLKTTNLNDGTPIRLYSNWTSGSFPAMCWYNNDPDTYRNIYGAYYNLYSVTSNKLCPSGWHVPGSTDWLQLFTFLGGVSIAGGKMKETGNSNWIVPNYGATNESGFTGLPSGYAYDKFTGAGSVAYFWSASITSVSNYPFSNIIYYNYYFLSYKDRSIGSNVTSANRYGFNVRCVKD